MSNVEWLLGEATDECTLKVGERADLDDACWRATIEPIEIGSLRLSRASMVTSCPGHGPQASSC